MLYIPSPFRLCTRCFTFYPDTPKYFRLSRHGKTTTPCRPCRLVYQHTHKLLNIDEYRKRDRERARKYRADNQEKVREADHKRLRKPKNPEREKLNRQRYRAKHRDEDSAYSRKWAKEHPDKVRAIAHRRRARLRDLPSLFTADDEARAMEYFDYQCAVCGRRAGFWHKIAMDHWIPISDPRPDNPGSVAWNMIPLCHSQSSGEQGCNNTKWSTDPIKWITKRLSKREANSAIARIEKYFEWVRQQR